MGIGFACWVPNGSNTLSQYTILIAARLQHWLHDRASMLRRTYTVCLFLVTNMYCYVDMFTGNILLRSS